MGQNPGYYQGLLDAYRENESVSTKQVDNDLQRTFPNHKVIDTDEYLRKMRRVLVAYSWRNPKVGYCQSMNFVCATALLFLSEEETFWLIVKVRLPPSLSLSLSLSLSYFPLTHTLSPHPRVL
eukprot:TRINITY_DN1545_c0_g1_i1.p1 TRINITY_DN1545_c0_g1~~TRINITY_DN1545_c0_g1_i1.p1  ORF type:complete len:123 (-),score=18.39 TRINITY_DN1545_c0_g1_i1:264-632(-)